MKICAACVAYYAADIRERILVRDILHSEVSFSFCTSLSMRLRENSFLLLQMHLSYNYGPSANNEECVSAPKLRLNFEWSAECT
jgi:hypothetical protein